MLKKILMLTLATMLLAGCASVPDEPADDLNTIVTETELTSEYDYIVPGEINIEWYNFFVSDQYWEMKLAAFEFFKAYYHADIQLAENWILDSEREHLLSWFPEEKRSLDYISGYIFSINRFTSTQKYYEIDGEQFKIISSYLNFSDSAEEKTFLLHLEMIYADGRWQIVFHGLDS